MNGKLSCLLTSFRASIAELSSRPSTVNSPAVQAAVDEVVARLANIDRLAQIQTDPVKPKTVLRNDALEAARAAAFVVGRRVLSYAHAHAARDLAARVDLRRFDYLRPPEKLVQLQKLHAAILPVAAELAAYDVDAAMLADLQAKIEAVRVAFDATRLAVVARKSATRELETESKALKRFFEQRVDPLIDSVRATHPEFHTRYTAARIVIDRPGDRVKKGDGKAAAPAATIATAAPATITECPSVIPLAA